VRSEEEKIWSILRAMAERENQIEQRSNKRMDRIERAHQLAIERLDRLEVQAREAAARQDRFERGTRKLFLLGMKSMEQWEKRQKAVEKEISELRAAQKAYFDSLRNGGNGRKHSR
jgi:hypothetical protein